MSALRMTSEATDAARISLCLRYLKSLVTLQTAIVTSLTGLDATKHRLEGSDGPRSGSDSSQLPENLHGGVEPCRQQLTHRQPPIARICLTNVRIVRQYSHQSRGTDCPIIHDSDCLHRDIFFRIQSESQRNINASCHGHRHGYDTTDN